MSVATATRVVKPARVGLVTAWRIERSKVRQSWFLGGAIVLGLFAQLLGVYNYLTNRAIIDSQGITWQAIWVQGGILVTSIFLPLLYAVVLAQVGALEHQSRGWQRLVAIDRVGTAVIGKILVALELAVIGLTAYMLTAIAAGLALGFDPAELGPYVARTACGAFGAWAMGAVVLVLGVWLRTFAAIAAAALAGIGLGMGFTMAAPGLTAAFPFAMITGGLGCRLSTEEFASPTSMALSVAAAVVWVAISYWLMRTYVRRHEW